MTSAEVVAATPEIDCGDSRLVMLFDGIRDFVEAAREQGAEFLAQFTAEPAEPDYTEVNIQNLRPF